MMKSSPSLGDAIITFMQKRSSWSGTATALLAALVEAAEHSDSVRGLPKDATRLSISLGTVTPALTLIGLSLKKERAGKRRTRSITLAWDDAITEGRQLSDAGIADLRKSYTEAERYYSILRQERTVHEANVHYARDCLDAGMDEADAIERLCQFSPAGQISQLLHKSTLLVARMQRLGA